MNGKGNYRWHTYIEDRISSPLTAALELIINVHHARSLIMTTTPPAHSRPPTTLPHAMYAQLQQQQKGEHRLPPPAYTAR